MKNIFYQKANHENISFGRENFENFLCHLEKAIYFLDETQSGKKEKSKWSQVKTAVATAEPGTFSGLQ